MICDRYKLDERGCIGVPDIMIEILRPGNNSIEIVDKMQLYESAGVKEYWVVSSQDQWMRIYTLTDGKFKESPYFVSGDVVTSIVLPDFSLNVAAMFKDIVPE